VEAADAGVREHEVAVGVAADEENIDVVATWRLALLLRRLVDDEDVLEDCVVLEHRQHWDFTFLFFAFRSLL